MNLGSFSRVALAALLQGRGSLIAAAADDGPGPRNGQPTEIRSVDGTLEVTLDVSLVTTEGLNRTAPGYNGAPVGPTLRANPGDVVRIKLVNNLAPAPPEDSKLAAFAMTGLDSGHAEEVNQTLVVNRLKYPTGNIWSLSDEDDWGYWGHSFQNLHFHGISVDTTIDDSRKSIDGGGQEMTYEFQIPEDSPTRFGFYHNHVHGTGVYSFLSGLYGFFVIEEPDAGTAPNAPTEQFLLLSESRTREDGTPVDFVPIVMDFDWDHITNGEQKPTLTFKKGEEVLFRAVNTGIEPDMTISIDGHQITEHKMDGFEVPNPGVVDSITLDAGSRAEFLVRFDTPGEYEFKRAAWDSGISGPACMAVFMIDLPTCISYDKETDVALIVVLDEEVSAADELEPPHLFVDTSVAVKAANGGSNEPYYQDLMAALPMAGSRSVTFAQAHHFPLFQIPYDGPFVPPATGMGVNGLFFNPHYFHGDIVGGTCEEWTISSVDTAPIHSFHAHSVPFYVTAVNGVELKESDRYWRDTMVVPGNFTATFCFQARETESYINVHCHMPAHQDIGMAAYYRLLPGATTPSEKTDENEGSPDSDGAKYVVTDPNEDGEKEVVNDPDAELNASAWSIDPIAPVASFALSVFVLFFVM